jgi:hypothetical protein
MSEQFKIELYKSAFLLCQQGYTIENGGKYDKRDKNTMSYTPSNLKEVYNVY